MTRRKFLTTLAKGALVTGAVGGLGALAELYGFIVTRRDIVVEGLPPAFDGFRIALLSDFHHSPWIPAAYIRTVVRRANRLGADLFALTGDFIDHGERWAPGCARALSRLRAPYGSVAVLGNHDYYKKAAPAMREGLARAGITELYNTGATIERAGETLHLAGTADLWRDKPNLKQALAKARQPKSVILLQHNPDYVERITDDRVGLVLSGHTHGGQCVLPFIGPPILPSKYGQKYAAGLVQGPVAQVFVTTGVGSGFPPVRFCCPPEIALLTLRCRPADRAV
jgi:predicted MPP superfamily phosphohydrolase